MGVAGRCSACSIMDLTGAKPVPSAMKMSGLSVSSRKRNSPSGPFEAQDVALFHFVEYILRESAAFHFANMQFEKFAVVRCVGQREIARLRPFGRRAMLSGCEAQSFAHRQFDAAPSRHPPAGSSCARGRAGFYRMSLILPAVWHSISRSDFGLAQQNNVMPADPYPSAHRPDGA